MANYLRRSSIDEPKTNYRRSSVMMARLAEEAERGDWRRAAPAVLGARSELLRYIGDERSGDWRFLLPRLPRGEALCVGGALSPVPLVLARTCRSVAVRCSPVEGRFLLARARQEGVHNISVIQAGADQCGQYDLVAALREPLMVDHSESQRAQRSQSLSRFKAYVSHFTFHILRFTFRPSSLVATHAVRPGGVLYMEVDTLALLRPPAILRARLRRLGFSGMRFYWPKPNFDRCEMLFPLGDRRMRKYYLNYQFFAMSMARRALRELLRVASAAGLFELALPGYMIVARRTEGVGP